MLGLSSSQIELMLRLIFVEMEVVEVHLVDRILVASVDIVFLREYMFFCLTLVL